MFSDAGTRRFAHGAAGLFRMKFRFRFEFVFGDGEKGHLHSKEKRRTILREGKSGKSPSNSSGENSRGLAYVFMLGCQP